MIYHKFYIGFINVKCKICKISFSLKFLFFNQFVGIGRKIKILNQGTFYIYNLCKTKGVPI